MQYVSRAQSGARDPGERRDSGSVIDSTHTFDDFDKAVARLSGRDVFGKVVITH
jgi:hypothetical protein